MKRFKLTLRTPQQLSLSRATSFNKHTVDQFFDNYRQVRLKYMFQPRNIYNLDECGIQTVHKLTKVITDIGDKFVAKMTSAERGSLVTMVGIISATGRAVPPFLIFPRVKFNETTMLKNAFSGTAGGANPSGWINSELFLQVLQHFAAHERPSKSSPLLIILDNHETHINLPAINFCRDNGIVLLTLPPHSSHKLQPLDVSVYRSFKLHFNAACSTWMVNHPGMAISIMDMAELVGKAFEKSFSLSNITSGFSKSGIEPYNDQKFTDDDFNPATVTDRDLPSPPEQREAATTPPEHQEAVTVDDSINEALVEPSTIGVAMPALSINTTSSSLPIDESQLAIAGPSSVTDHLTPNRPTIEENAITPPEDVCPYPKAKPRKESNKGRKKGKSLILTSTPVKNSIEAEIQRKKDLEQEKVDRKKAMLEKREAKKKEKLEKLTRKKEMMKKKAEDKENKTKEKVNAKEQMKKRNSLRQKPSCSKKLKMQQSVSSSESESDTDMKRLCDDSSSEGEFNHYEDPESNETCLICGEVGYGRQLWFRCVSCGLWAHQLCSGWDTPEDYVCDLCI